MPHFQWVERLRELPQIAAFTAHFARMVEKP
jgi:hypothetical protein